MGDAHSMSAAIRTQSSGQASSVTPSHVTTTYMEIIQCHHTKISARGEYKSTEKRGGAAPKCSREFRENAAVMCEALMRGLLAQRPYEPPKLVRSSTPYITVLVKTPHARYKSSRVSNNAFDVERGESERKTNGVRESASAVK